MFHISSAWRHVLAFGLKKTVEFAGRRSESPFTLLFPIRCCYTTHCYHVKSQFSWQRDIETLFFMYFNSSPAGLSKKYPTDLWPIFLADRNDPGYRRRFKKVHIHWSVLFIASFVHSSVRMMLFLIFTILFFLFLCILFYPLLPFVNYYTVRKK
jgi:hypothetical protein